MNQGYPANPGNNPFFQQGYPGNPQQGYPLPQQQYTPPPAQSEYDPLRPYGNDAYGGAAGEVLDAYLPNEDNSDGLGAIPENQYVSRVTDVEQVPTAAGGMRWAITLEVADGGLFTGRKLFYSMNWLDGHGNLSGGIGFTQMAMKALGLPVIGDRPIQVRKSDIVGKMVLATVSIQTTGQYRGRNQTDKLEPMPQGQGMPQAPGPQYPQQQYQQPPQQQYTPQPNQYQQPPAGYPQSQQPAPPPPGGRLDF